MKIKLMIRGHLRHYLLLSVRGLLNSVLVAPDLLFSGAWVPLGVLQYWIYVFEKLWKFFLNFFHDFFVECFISFDCVISCLLDSWSYTFAISCTDYLHYLLAVIPQGICLDTCFPRWSYLLREYKYPCR